MKNPKIDKLHVKSTYMTKAASQISREKVDFFVLDSQMLQDKINSL